MASLKEQLRKLQFAEPGAATIHLQHASLLFSFVQAFIHRNSFFPF